MFKTRAWAETMDNDNKDQPSRVVCECTHRYNKYYWTPPLFTFTTALSSDRIEGCAFYKENISLPSASRRLNEYDTSVSQPEGKSSWRCLRDI